jgi:GT2 family glycosyltransferase/glycosyltransferase involved in cell wall biosynthesis
VIAQLEEQARSQSAQSAEEVRRLEQQLRSQVAQSAQKMRQLEEQSAQKVRRLEEQVANVNLALDEARRLCQSMTRSLSWRLTWPLRLLRDAVAAILKKAKRRYKSPLQSTDKLPTEMAGLPDSCDPVPLVNWLYKAALGRLAEPEGLKWCVHQLRSGVSPQALAEEIVGSPEFRARHGTSQRIDAEFLTAIYRDGLGRQPDPERLAHWLAEGKRGVTRVEVLAALAGSNEALQRAIASATPLQTGDSTVLANSLNKAASSRPADAEEQGMLPEPTISRQQVEKLNIVENLTRELAVFLASGHRLSFPAAKAPDVSVIIVLFNQAHFTLQCLRALLAHSGVSLELILVDNCSTDRTPELLAKLDNVRILRNRENAGFVLGVNQAAANITGRTILLLNSDAFIRKGALKIALQTLGSDERIGAVGGRLILPSGQLQEAGSIVWSDASAHGYGRNFSPEAGEVMFRRDVDYCSAAFLLTTRVLFERMGGLDPVYAPAYYEDADYCLRLWQAGFRVVYEPLAVVDHYEYGSETRDGASTALMNRNRKRFRLRHANTLQCHHFPTSQANILFARNHIDANLRLLVIDIGVPLSALGTGFPRMRAILNEAVAAGWFVTLYPLDSPSVNWEAAYSELAREIEICGERGVSGLAEFLAERSGYYHTILVSRPDNMARFKEAVSSQPHVVAGSRVIYDAEAIFAAREILCAELEGRPLTAADADAMITQEIKLTADVDAVVTVSPSEAQLMRERQPGPVYVLSHPTCPEWDAPSWEARTGFLFVGRLLEKTAPNYQGLTWFLRLVWPAIRTTLNEVNLLVVGALHPEHTELIKAGVQLLGRVEDLEPLYNRARLFVSPIRFAAGVPIKILEAGAAGLPVVGTKLMAKQLGWEPGVEIEATDEPTEMAKSAIALYRDSARWERMRTAALHRLARDYSDTAFRSRLRAFLQGDDPVENRLAEPKKTLQAQDIRARR